MYVMIAPVLTGILIGGKSTRMGTNKAVLPWRDSTIIETIVQAARTITTECVLLGTCENLPDSLSEMLSLPDPRPNAGPLAGLCALLDYAPNGWCVLLSCDVPNISQDAIIALTGHITPDTKAVAYTTDQSSIVHSTAALYHTDLRDPARRALDADQRSLHRFIRSVPHTLVPADRRTERALRNVNVPADYTPPR